MHFIGQSFGIAQYNFETQEYVQHTVQGVVGEGSGLGYYQEPYYEEFIVTHLASGNNLGYTVYFEEHAQKWIEALVSLWDWSISAKEIYALPKEESQKVKKTLEAITDDFQPLSSLMSKKRSRMLYNKGKEQAGVTP